MAIPITRLAEMLSEYADTPIYLVGDGYYAARRGLLSAGVRVETTPELLLRENAYSVATVGARKYEAGEVLSDKELAPTYLRMPQAERERLERERAVGGDKQQSST